MSWLFQPVVVPSPLVVVDTPKGIPIDNRAWLWDGLAPMAARLRSAGVPAVGPATVATLFLDLESGAKLSLEWLTDVMKSWNGKEQRVQLLGAPRQKYSGKALLADEDDRSVRAKFLAGAANGSAFLLGLPYEELSIAADSVGTVVTCYSTTTADWLQAGQRVLVLDIDDTLVELDGFVLQSATSTTITLNAPCDVKAGGRIMPAIAVYLESQQGLGRYVVNQTELSIAARAAEFGFAGSDAMGVDATLTEFDDLYVWDRRDIDSVAADSMQSGSEVVDMGAMPLGVGSAVVPDWGREVTLTGNVAEWQWLKAFLAATAGRCKPFLLPTFRPDMLLLDVNANDIVVASADVEGAGDAMEWLDAVDRQRIAILHADGTQEYLVPDDWADNLDGTATIDCSQDLTPSTTATACWLELVRWESDEHTIMWVGDQFTFVAIARVVQQ